MSVEIDQQKYQGGPERRHLLDGMMMRGMMMRGFDWAMARTAHFILQGDFILQGVDIAAGEHLLYALHSKKRGRLIGIAHALTASRAQR